MDEINGEYCNVSIKFNALVFEQYSYEVKLLLYDEISIYLFMYNVTSGGFPDNGEKITD